MFRKIEEIAPYIPYGLNVKYCDIYDSDQDFEYKIQVTGMFEDAKALYKVTMEPEHYPILRPLEDLFEIEEITDEMSDNEIDYLEALIDSGLFKEDKLVVNYQAVKLMFKNFIDIFGLIDRNKAINYHEFK